MSYLGYTIYQNSFGQKIQTFTGIDLSTATTIKFKVKKPDDTLVEWIGSVNTTNNKILEYTIQQNDLDLIGEYLLQAVYINTNTELFGNTISFKVTEEFE